MSDNQYVVDISTNADSTNVEELANALQEVENNADSAGNAISGIDTGQLGAVDSEAKNAGGNLGDVQTGADSAASGIKGIPSDTVKEVSKISKEASEGLTEGADAADLMAGALTAIIGLGIADTMYSLADAAGDYNESWERVALTTGGSVENIGEVQSKWSGAIAKMQADTSRGAGVIRYHIQTMGESGVTDLNSIEESFRAIAGTAYATGTPIDSLEKTFQRVAASGMFSSRTLLQAGISTQDVYNATGKTVEQLSDSFKTMTPNQRAATLATILNTKYNKEGNEANKAYSDSWADVKDQAGLAGDYLKRVAGAVILPILIPAIEIATSWLRQLGDWFNRLSGPQKTFIGTLIVVGGVLGIVGSAIATLITLKGAFVAITNLSKLAQVGETAATTADYVAKDAGILSTLRLAATNAFYRGIAVAATIVNYGLAAAQWAVNAAMNANPISIIIILILALAAVIIYLWQTNSGFRNAVIGIWNAISGAFIYAGQQIYNTLAWIWSGILWFLGLIPRIPLIIALYLAAAVLKFVLFGVNAGVGARNAGNQIVNAITSTISSIPGRMFTWGAQLLSNFVNGIRSQFPNLTGALDYISAHLPHSPPKIGPLSTITAANMFAWASDIAYAGILGFSTFSLGNVAMPSLSPVGYGSASLGFDATEINNVLSLNSNENNKRPINVTVYQDGIMSQEEAAEFTVNAIVEQAEKENLITGKS